MHEERMLLNEATYTQVNLRDDLGRKIVLLIVHGQDFQIKNLSFIRDMELCVRVYALGDQIIAPAGVTVAPPHYCKMSRPLHRSFTWCCHVHSPPHEGPRVARPEEGMKHWCVTLMVI